MKLLYQASKRVSAASPAQKNRAAGPAIPPTPAVGSAEPVSAASGSANLSRERSLSVSISSSSVAPKMRARSLSLNDCLKPSIALASLSEAPLVQSLLDIQDDAGNAPLHHAAGAACNNSEVLGWLLENNANIFVQNQDKETFLHQLIKSVDKEKAKRVISLLYSRVAWIVNRAAGGVNQNMDIINLVNEKNKTEETVLHLLIEQSIAICKQMVAFGLKDNVQDMMVEAHARHLILLELLDGLLKLGAHIGIKDKEGLSVWEKCCFLHVNSELFDAGVHAIISRLIENTETQHLTAKLLEQIKSKIKALNLPSVSKLRIFDSGNKHEKACESMLGEFVKTSAALKAYIFEQTCREQIEPGFEGSLEILADCMVKHVYSPDNDKNLNLDEWFAQIKQEFDVFSKSLECKIKEKIGEMQAAAGVPAIAAAAAAI